MDFPFILFVAHWQTAVVAMSPYISLLVVFCNLEPSATISNRSLFLDAKFSNLIAESDISIVTQPIDLLQAYNAVISSIYPEELTHKQKLLIQ